MREPSADLLIKIGLGVAAIVAVLYLARRVGGAAAQAANAIVPSINPADSRNIVNRAVAGVGAAITGDSDFTLGGWIYDITHTNPMRQVDPVDYGSAGLSDFDAMGNSTGGFSNYPEPFGFKNGQSESW